MEFPHLGANCHEKLCKQLDFLPMKCDACHNIFCADHFAYDKHSCPESYKKDNQVPVCPLCNRPVPIRPGELPDLRVGEHIDRDCQSDKAKEKRKVYSNRCTFTGCKQKELIPFHCEKCQNNFCVRHRLEEDHQCQGFLQSGRPGTKAGAAALARTYQTNGSLPTRKTPQTTAMSAIGKDLNRDRQMRQSQGGLRAMQGGMTEEQAMAAAIAASLIQPPAANQPIAANQPTHPPTHSSMSQEEEDLALARAIAASEEDAQRQQQQHVSSKEKSCLIC